MNVPKNAPTLLDVARQAGVSRVAASVVINGARSGTRVSPETRKRIEEAAASMGYHPNAVARGLVRGRMNTIGIVRIVTGTDLSDPYFGPLIHAITTVALRHKQFTTLFFGQMWQDARQSLPLYCDGRCDGMLLLAPPQEDSDIIPALLKTHVPFVLVGEQYEAPGVTSVDVDSVAESRKIVNYLIGLGHRRIACLDTFSFLSHSVALRVTGYREALRDHGIEDDPRLVLSGYIYYESVKERIETLMALPKEQRPTAIFGVTDGTAIWVLDILREMGINVPEEMSVAGFDDFPPAATATPALTTIRQNPYGVGARAAELLLEMIEGKTEPGSKEFIPAELIVRQSTAPPPG
jgi:DNA-binding LacI/PurR family transcriptional regulator